MSETGDVLEDAERFQRLFVVPMVDAVRAEMQTHLAPIASAQKGQQATLDQHTKDIASLKATESKVLKIWAYAAAIVTAVIGPLGVWLKKKIHIG